MGIRKNQKGKAAFITFLVFCLALTACGQPQPGASSDLEETQAVTSNSTDTLFNEPGVLPMLKEKRTFTIGMAKSANVEDYETNKFTAFLEENTNIHLQFILFPEEDAKQKLSIMINANDDLPDIINMSLTDSEVAQYGAFGAFLPLNDYYEDSYYIKKRLDEEGFREDLPYITSPDGNIYTVPEDWKSIGNDYSWKAYVNQTWLDQLGMAVPETTGEFYEVLKSFKTKDPNENGKQDEIPFVGNSKGWRQRAEIWLMNAFVYCNPDSNYLILENGKLDAAYTQEAWKKGLEYMNRLCQEDLLPPLSFTQDTTQFKALLENGDEQVIGAFPANSFSVYPPDSKKKGDFVPLPPQKGPEGIQYAVYTNSSLPVNYFYITKSCPSPEAAFKLADFMVSDEAQIFQRYGEKDVDWKIADDAMIPFWGEPKYRVQSILQWGSVQNSHWQSVCPKFGGDSFFTECWDGVMDPSSKYFNNAMMFQATKLYIDKQPAEVVREIIYSPDEAEQITDIMTSLTSYVEEAMVAFITGGRGFDTWDSYLAEFEAIGLPEYLRITQQAYDRMMLS